MTHTLEIAKDHWGSVLDIISRGAHGRPARLEIETMELGDQLLEIALPLRELDLESKGSAARGLMIALGDDGAELVHTVDDPDVICIGYSDSAELEWLAIAGIDGSKTILYFEELPELPADTQAEGAPAQM